MNLLVLALIVATKLCHSLMIETQNINYRDKITSKNKQITNEKEARSLLTFYEHFSNELKAVEADFFHGVSSGEPSSSSLIIWTRLTPYFQSKTRQMLFNHIPKYALNRKFQLFWMISSQNFTNKNIFYLKTFCLHARNTQCGYIYTSKEIDYTAKIKVNNLKANEKYYFQFIYKEKYSDFGQAKTLPYADSHVESVRFAFGSCKQYQWGFYNNLRDLAARDDIEYMIWLGDDIYEYPNGITANGSEINRVPLPNKYLFTLADYRTRHAQDKSDTMQQSLRRKMSWIISWDDHELVNNHWKDGSYEHENGNFANISFTQRKANAYQAFFEWNPIKRIDVGENGGLFAKYEFGDLFDLLMTDSRSQRTQLANSSEFGKILDYSRHYMFGEVQREWFFESLLKAKNNGKRWKLVGNHVLFGYTPPSPVPGIEMPTLDIWDGYASERQLLLDFIVENQLTNVVVLTGDVHTSIVQKIFNRNPYDNNFQCVFTGTCFAVAAEFTCDAISNFGVAYEDILVQNNIYSILKNLDFIIQRTLFQSNGYSIVNVNRSTVAVEMWQNDNVKRDDTFATLNATFCVNYLDGHLSPLNPVNIIECPSFSRYKQAVSY